jgi:type IV secretion system protein VirD4
MKITHSPWFLKIKILIAFSVVILLGCGLATEITAYQLGFQNALGQPLIDLNTIGKIALITLTVSVVGLAVSYWMKTKRLQQSLFIAILGLAISALIFPLYNPLDFFYWWWQYHDRDGTQTLWTAGFIITGSALLLCIGLLIYYRMKFLKAPKTSDTHGSAHFATPEKIEKTGLLGQTSPFSVYVGAWQDPITKKVHYLRFAGPENVFIYAPSRSGKGVGLVIPTLLSYLGSIIISDFKGENWQLTAGWRQSIGHRVFKFEPTDATGSSACFNSLLEVRKGIYEIRDIQNIVDMISDPDGQGRSDHWTKSANDLLVSLILHTLYAEKDKSLAGVRKLISNPHRSDVDTFTMMLTAIHDPNNQYGWIDDFTEQPTQTHPAVAAGAKDMLNKSEGERNGVISTLKTYLNLYRDPIIAKNTSTSDFSINDLVFNEKPTSLYFVISPGDIDRVMPLVRLIVSQIIKRLTEEMDFMQGINRSKDRHPLKLLFDEFPLFGRLSFYEKDLGYLAGYGISSYLITQDLTQLYKSYGHYQSIIANCNVRIAYTPNTNETAKHLAELLGTTTIVKEHKHYSGDRLGLFLKNINVGKHETKRDLMTPDELMRLSKDSSLIFVMGFPAIEGCKIRYFNDPVFSQRAKIKAPPTDRLPVKTEWTWSNMHPELIKSSIPDISPLSEQDILLADNDLGENLLPDNSFAEEDSLI